MICLNCRRQIPDSSKKCPYCNKEVLHHIQLPREISYRRYQRWFFYGVLILMFSGMIGVILKIYDTNTNLLLSIANIEKEYEKVGEELETTKSDLASRDLKVSELETSLSAQAAELEEKTAEFKQVLDEKTQLEQERQDLEKQLESSGDTTGELDQKIQECKSKLDETDANIYGLIIRLGTGISNANLDKIPMADANLGGPDDDEDGLSNMIEDALGTDKNKRDTDGDGYDDKSEIIAGYNPNGAGQMPIDMGFADRQKGKILLQVENNGEAWYVDPSNSKRYFLGKPADAFRILAGDY